MEKTKNDKKNENKSLAQDFDVYSLLFHDLFFDLLQVSITLLLFVGILNLSKEDAETLYPTDLHSRFYADTDDKTGNCDLGKMRAGETSFCDGRYEIKDFNEKLSGKSIFATKVSVYAKNMGYVTSDSFSILLLWLSYLAFDCEHFTQKMLKGMHNISKSLYDSPFILQFLIVVTVISLVNHLNINIITPFLTKLFNIFNINQKKNHNNILLEIANDLFINFACIFVLLFLFFMVPLTIYYIFSLCKILSENLSIQMNLLSVFAVFLCVKSLMLFVQFMQGQFGKDAIKKQSKGKQGKDQIMAIASAGIQHKREFDAFISSYILYFFIPIIVALAKIYKLITSLVSNIKILELDIRYKLIFISIILLSFYYPIKKDLDDTFKFPYSIIYATFATIAVILITYQNKSNI